MKLICITFDHTMVSTVDDIQYIFHNYHTETNHKNKLLFIFVVVVVIMISTYSCFNDKYLFCEFM